MGIFFARLSVQFLTKFFWAIFDTLGNFSLGMDARILMILEFAD